MDGRGAGPGQGPGLQHWDTLIALSLAFLINVSILVLAAGSFYGRLPQPVTDLSEAYRLLTPMLGTTVRPAPSPWP
nr:MULTISPECIES: divalent metal cation transporter [unclassified Synechococcus]